MSDTKCVAEYVFLYVGIYFTYRMLTKSIPVAATSEIYKLKTHGSSLPRTLGITEVYNVGHYLLISECLIFKKQIFFSIQNNDYSNLQKALPSL